jgi:NADH-quinone oxidoreductase subunit E
MSLTDTTREQMREIIARYPRPRSALMPMLHLVQAEEGYVTPEGIEVCAQELGLTTAEVSAVATFYTMYKRRPVGDYHVGVCTNTLCAILGGDAIFSALKEHLGVGNDETTADGKVTLEHIECNAACDYAPVMTVNWEFMDNMTPESARQLVDDLAAGVEVHSTRGPRLCTFKEVERVLAGFPDGRAGEGPSAGPASLAGLRLARERGDEAPKRPAPAAAGAGAPGDAASGGAPSAHDAPASTAVSDPANAARPSKEN